LSELHDIYSQLQEIESELWVKLQLPVLFYLILWWKQKLILVLKGVF